MADEFVPMAADFDWQYTGIVIIPHISGDPDKAIELPFSADSLGGEALLTNEQLEEIAMDAANQYLSLFNNSDPTRRSEFGMPTEYFMISIVDVPIPQ